MHLLLFDSYAHEKDRVELPLMDIETKCALIRAERYTYPWHYSAQEITACACVCVYACALIDDMQPLRSNSASDQELIAIYETIREGAKAFLWAEYKVRVGERDRGVVGSISRCPCLRRCEGV